MIKVLAAAVVAVSLAACSSAARGPSQSPASSTVVTGAYLDVVRPVMPAVSDRVLLNIGHAICGDLRGGSSWVDEIGAAVKAGHLSGYRAGELTGAAVSAFCPDQRFKTP
jgi:hypothetical protein